AQYKAGKLEVEYDSVVEAEVDVVEAQVDVVEAGEDVVEAEEVVGLVAVPHHPVLAVGQNQ
ncbi:hypothetical protein C0991_007305, partial [Blastosporella zonata]